MAGRLQKVLTGKWAMYLMYLLDEAGTIRFNELQRRMPEDMTHTTLSRQLKALEEDGLIVRTEYAQIPPKVEYSLSDIGKKFHSVLVELEKWGNAECRCTVVSAVAFFVQELSCGEKAWYTLHIDAPEGGMKMETEKVYAMPFAKIYPMLVAKAVRKGRTQAEVDEIIGWLTGYSAPQIEAAVQNGTLYGDFFRDAPQLNPDRVLIKGSICGVKLESIEEPLMKEIRYLDKLVDELAKGKAMEKIKRTSK